MIEGGVISENRRESRVMRPMPMDLFGEMDEQGSAMAMDVDDVDSLDIFGEGVIVADNKLADADFFNSFEDDFDDTDIN
ncbi:small acidic protein 1-like [Prosopis cineraria]|uniref:small acidic protein 1-like n=1 Tax=Prosopis cineraria TaxID=364024 RepID=UPI00240F1968|nr:small acidic protein 1-like [Prosopis cineraria]XP_054807981.1 small acidic protein 1-like [Prosopis cineraria]